MDADNPGLKASLKFWIYDLVDRQGYNVWHAHEDVWQLDCAELGRASMAFDGVAGEIEMLPGDAILIPPGIRHAYNYSGSYGNWSMKFLLSGFDGELKPLKLPSDTVNGILSGALAGTFGARYQRDAVRGECLVCPEQFEDAHVVESLLACLIARNFAANRGEQNLAGLVKKMLRERHGRSLKAEDAASALCYSSSHFNALMKSCAGKSAKAFIDEERGGIAKELLLYSDMNVNEVSSYMGFPDPFCFNKFFQRVCGQPPGRFRRQGGQSLIASKPARLI